MIRLKKITCSVLIFAIYLGALAPRQILSFGDAPATASAMDDDSMKDEKRGLRFRLSQGAEQEERRPADNVAQATTLTASEVESVLKRLPPIKAEASDEQEFALRERSLPPPRTGETIKISFPPPVPSSLPDQMSSGPLEVLRFSPEGEVPLAPQLSVTFSQPMIALTSQADLAAGDVPVRLTPPSAGRWRWVGTKTLLFEPEGERFPMATEYTATVPSGTRSGTGGTLAVARTWKFATPPPQVKTMYPQSGPQRRDTLMFVEFDQRIDAVSVLRAIKVQAEAKEVRTRLATQDEITADATVREFSKKAQPGRWLAWRAIDENGRVENALPADATVTISVGRGTPSLEGPRTTQTAQTFSFKTFGPLRVTEHRCGYQPTCSPFDIWTITFSNPLDPAVFEDSQIRVEPAVPRLKTTLYGTVLQLAGGKPGRTVYKVSLDASLRDSFGQTLGKDTTVTFNVGSAPPVLTSSGGQFVVLDPAAAARFSVYSINHSNFKVKLYSVSPNDWQAFSNYLRNRQGYGDAASKGQGDPPGRLAFSRTIPVNAKPDEMVETRIDLGPALENGLGQVIVIVESITPTRNRYGLETVVAWVQSTNIGS